MDPTFIQTYEEFARQYKRLAEILEDYSLGTALLDDLITITKEVERLRIEQNSHMVSTNEKHIS